MTAPDSTGDRIVAAAVAEFSRHGIAGARIERIAKAARTSKERVYAYYRSKEALYRHVVLRELAAVAEATRMDPADLPGYAGRVHDYFQSHPERFRLMRWGQLEFAESSDDPIQNSVRGKVGQLRAAQKAGLLDTAWDPIDILMFVNQIAMTWAGQPDAEPSFLAARREAVVEAVQRLFPKVAP